MSVTLPVKTGTTVKLNSGSPDMTVVDTIEVLLVKWVDNEGNPQGDMFRPETLTIQG